MPRAWAQIDKRMDERRLAKDESFESLWGVIGWALRRANKAERDRRKRDADQRHKLAPVAHREQCLMVAEAATTIAETILDGPLDKCAHEFFPTGVVHLARVGGVGFGGLSAARADLEWTSIVEVFRAFASRARLEAESQPIVERVTREYALNHFIRLMAKHSHDVLGGTMDVSLAAIASVTLNRKVAAKDVKRALNPTKENKKA